MSDWITYRNADVAEGEPGCCSDGEVVFKSIPESLRGGNETMDYEDGGMGTRIASILAKLEKEDADVLESFFETVNKELGKRDSTIAKSVMNRLADALDRLVRAHTASDIMNDLLLDTLSKALRGEEPTLDSRDLVDEATRRMIDADPDTRIMRLEVAKAVQLMRGEGLRKNAQRGTYDLAGKLADALEEHVDERTEDIPKAGQRQCIGVEEPARGRRFMKKG